MGKGDVPALIFRRGKTAEGWGEGNRDPNAESCPADAVEAIPGFSLLGNPATVWAYGVQSERGGCLRGAIRHARGSC